MSVYRALIQLFISISLATMLIACDSGSDVIANPNLGSATGGYNGPPAKDSPTRAFQLHFWTFLREDNRCGQCHGAGTSPEFVDKTDVNKAYLNVLGYVDLQDPSSSLVVRHVGDNGHNCWLGAVNAAACAAIVEQMVTNWANNSNISSARLIQLTAPQLIPPGAAKSFPPSGFDIGTGVNANGADSFAQTVHPLLTAFCQDCHQETASTPIAPFFANADVESAFAAAKAKMDIDTPSNSRFVVRLRQESHNCWTNNCASDAQDMEDAIATFANGIDPTAIDVNLVTSMALVLLSDGIIASGGSRHEINQFALWEFKSGSTNPASGMAFDTSGIDPAINLTLSPSLGAGVSWLGGYGLQFNGGSAFATTGNSQKINDYVQITGEYAIEAWVIPANVTQQDRNIVSYSISDTRRNFTLGQEMYDYRYYNRVDDPDPLSLNGEPFLTSADSGNEILQASLQHVVVNYDPANGRNIYVNGALVFSEPVTPTTIGNGIWDETYSFILGNEVGGPQGGARSWNGQLRLVALHNRILTPAQVLQNFDVGVGEKYFLLFYVGHQPGVDAGSYILFEVSQFDSYSYLFSTPTFINLDPNWTPVSSINIQGMRIAINGKEAYAGQAFANLDVTVDSANYDPQLGQQLSPVGTIIALEKTAATDEFFLTFESIGGASNAFTDPQAAVAADPPDPAAPVSSDIGVRTFQEINASISAITGVRTTNSAVTGVYDTFIQQLPSVEAIDAFLPSHQMAIAQLALTSCSEMVEGRGTISRSAYFPGFNFNQDAQTAFGSPPAAAFYQPPQPTTPATATQLANRSLIVDPLLRNAMNVIAPLDINNLTSQPDSVVIHDMLGSDQTQVLDAGIVANTDYESLVTEMLGCKLPVTVPPTTSCTPINTIARTAQIAKAACAAAVGGAVMLVQ